MKLEQNLIDQYVETFSVLDGLELVDAGDDDSRFPFITGSIDSCSARWHPQRRDTNPSALSEVYLLLAGPLPPLFETMLLTYRWGKVKLGAYTLRPNPLGSELKGFISSVLNDERLARVLLGNKLFPFALSNELTYQGTEIDPEHDSYDPICFDLNQINHTNECPIIRADYGDAKFKGSVKEVEVIAPSFKQLVENTIALARGR